MLWRWKQTNCDQVIQERGNIIIDRAEKIIKLKQLNGSRFIKAYLKVRCR